MKTQDEIASLVPRLAEDQLLNLVPCAPSAAVIWHQGRILQANQLFLDLFGCESGSAALGQPISRFLPDHKRASRSESAGSRSSLSNARECETTGKKTDGTSFPLRLSLSALDLRGSPAFFASCADLGESRRAEESLRRTQFSIDHAVDLVYWVDSKGRLVDASAATVKRLGFSREELLGMTLFDFTIGLTPQAWPELWEAGKSGSCTVEREFKTKAGEVFPVAISVNYLAEEGREYHCAFARDITKRKKTEEALRLTQLSVDAAADLIHWIGPDGRLLYVSDSTCRRHGYSREELLGMSIFELDPSMSPTAWKKHWREIKRRGSLLFESVHRTKDGEFFPLELTVNYVECDGREYDFAFGRDITERKLAEEALRQANERLSLATVAGGVGIWELDVVNNKLTGDDEMFRLYGMDSSSFGGAYETWKARVHPEDLERSDAEVQLALRGEKEFDTEFRVVWPSGAIHHIRARAQVHRDAAGQPLRLIGTNYDITERNQAVAALSKSEERFRQVAESAGEWIWETDADGLYTYASPAIARMLGYQAEEVVGKTHFYDLFHPEDRETLKLAALAAFAAKQPLREFVNRNLHKNGQTVWLSTSGLPLLDDAGNLLGYRGADTDITARKRAEELLKDEISRRRILVEQSRDGIVVVKQDGSVAEANEQYAQMLGYTLEEAYKLCIWDWDAAHPKEQLLEILKAVGTEGDHFETRHRRKDGTLIDVEISTNAAVFGDEKLVFCICRDITERKRAEEALAVEKEHLSLLYDAAVEMSHCRTASEVQRAGIRLACKASDSDGGVIWLRQSAVRSHIIGSQGLTREGRVQLTRILRTSPAVERVQGEQISVQLGEAELLKDGASGGNVFAGVLVVPIVSRGKAMGVLCLATERDHPHLNTAHTALVEGIAVLVSVAVENARLYEAARYLAERDPVTGLLNHRGINTQLEKELARSERSGSCFAVAMMDLDDFKLFNDTYGHASGDEVLRNVSAILQRAVRRGDVVGRYGGDEFVALLPDTDVGGAVRIIERIQETLGESGYSADGYTPVPVFMSYGVATYPFEGRHVGDLLAAADANLYSSKRQGGNCVTAPGSAEEPTDTGSGLFSVLEGLVTAVDGRDHYTRKHSDDVCEHAVALASELGLSSETQRCVRIAALLHDVGKIGIPDHILRKPGGLTDEEYETVKQHVNMGELIIKEIPNLVDVLGAASSHHERYDGQGYPRGLEGEDIPLLGRILAAVDAYSAMTTDRPYRKALTLDEARRELKSVSGTQLDPKIVTAFLATLDKAS